MGEPPRRPCGLSGSVGPTTWPEESAGPTTTQGRIGLVRWQGILTEHPRVLRLWRTPSPVEGSPERLMLWAQVMTGLGMDAGGKVYRIDDRQTGTPKWQERRDQLQKL